MKKAKKGKEKETTLDDLIKCKRKYNQLLMEVGIWRDGRFPVATVLEIVGASKWSKLQKKWKEMHARNVKSYMRMTKLIAETFKAVAPPPSHVKP